MEQEDASQSGSPQAGFPRQLLVVLLSLGCLAVSWYFEWTILFLLSQVVVISLVIWQACDPFADAAQWIGAKFRLPGSVRGATLDAISSSMPELFSGIFFVVVAISSADDSQSMVEAGAEGFGATIATCAGSAIYNMILIPAVCAIVISFARRNRPTIDVEPEVITRDGLWFVGCQAMLLAFLYQNEMHWWMAVVFLGFYVLYIVQLYRDARRFQLAHDAVHDYLQGEHGEIRSTDVIEALRTHGFNVPPTMVDRIRRELENQESDPEQEDETPESAGVLFGYWSVPLNDFSCWLVILAATFVAAIACYWLVEVTRATASELSVPTFFVAVILAAAASSVPDTFLSMASALRGDDSGAVSNAFGSNIFDICVCISIPLLVNSYLVGWQPVSLLDDGRPIPGLFGLRILLCVLTLVTLLVMWHNRQLTRNKAIVLCLLYAVFVAYAVAGSLGWEV